VDQWTSVIGWIGLIGLIRLIGLIKVYCNCWPHWPTGPLAHCSTIFTNFTMHAPRLSTQIIRR